MILEAAVRWAGGESVGSVKVGVERLAAARIVLWLVGHDAFNTNILEGVDGVGGGLLIEAMGTQSAGFGVATIGTVHHLVGICSTRKVRVGCTIHVRGTDSAVGFNCQYRYRIGESESEEEELEGSKIHWG